MEFHGICSLLLANKKSSECPNGLKLTYKMSVAKVKIVAGDYHEPVTLVNPYVKPSQETLLFWFIVYFEASKIHSKASLLGPQFSKHISLRIAPKPTSLSLNVLWAINNYMLKKLSRFLIIINNQNFCNAYARIHHQFYRWFKLKQQHPYFKSKDTLQHKILKKDATL